MLLLELGAKIKRARMVTGMSQEALASVLDTNCVTVSRWETGRQSPSYITLWRISEALGTSLSNMLEEGKAGFEDGFQYLFDIRQRKSNTGTQFERILRDLAGLNPDIIVLIQKTAEAWDGIGNTKRQVLSEGLSFVLGNFWSSQVK